MIVKTEKYCKKCDTTLPIDRFYTNGFNTRKDGTKVQKYKPTCKDCELGPAKERKDRYISEILEELGVSRECSRCGYNEHIAALDFHHVRGTKSFTIGKKATASKAVLKEEIEKCIILCANCHRVEHATEGRE